MRERREREGKIIQGEKMKWMMTIKVASTRERKE
jgi:hypothetical protein